jgi:LmbE family N-acetylglucosaminyl deacetylase
MLNKLKKILIVCAHPDDEVIGCGGTISLLSKTAKIDLLVFTNGEGSRKFSSDEQYKKKTLQRKQMLQKSSKVLGIKNIHQLNFRDNQLDTYPLLEITKELEKYLKKYKPDTIFTHYKNDLNIDHRKVFEAVITATRPFKNTFIKNLLSFEITSSTELSYSKNQFNPNFFVDIKDKIKSKKKSLKIYKNQFDKELGLLTIENIINLAKYRGSYIGSKYAEAFEIVRIII